MVGENIKSFHVCDPDGWDLELLRVDGEDREATLEQRVDDGATGHL
jgi:hypothetical protein